MEKASQEPTVVDRFRERGGHEVLVSMTLCVRVCIIPWARCFKVQMLVLSGSHLFCAVPEGFQGIGCKWNR